jgi:chromosome segregation ATPase
MIQQEDENLKKLKHVEIENSKLKDTRRKLRSELVSCENTVVILKKQLEDFEKLREETISLKTLLEEERRIGEVMNVQMKKKEEYCEKIEQEVVSLRKSVTHQHYSLWQVSQVLHVSRKCLMLLISVASIKQSILP